MPLLLPLLLMQVSPDPSGLRSPYASSLPPEIVEKKATEERKRRNETAVQGPAAPEGGEAGCMDAVQADPAGTADMARQAMTKAQGRERVRAGLCLGLALSELDRWDDARTAFMQARDAADPADHLSRARLGGMAGNAALAGGKAQEALDLLAPAVAAAKMADDQALVAAITTDRARALVSLEQLDEAALALSDARTADPDNGQAWLLSATLSRRQNKLTNAQAQIEKAAQLAPEDPDVGLEAGVIAVLSGREDAARKSWKSVLDTSPNSAQAETAREYIAQLGPESTAPKAPIPR